MTETSSRTNQYRFGVLEANHVEDRFSLDLLAKQERKPLPLSTMKDHYKWYNSILFEHRNEYLERFPELAEHIKGDKALQHSMTRPPHLVQQDVARTNKPHVEKMGSGEGHAGIPAGPKQAQGAPKMFVCCSQDDAMERHGVLQSMVPAGISNRDAMDKSNAQENESKNFSQVGGWILHGYQGRNSMYTRDREGIVEETPDLKNGKQDPQISSCTKHLLFGHGNNLTQFRERDFRTCTDLAINNKIKSKVFLDSHFDAEHHLAKTASQLGTFHTAHRSSSTSHSNAHQNLSQSNKPYISTYAPPIDTKVSRYGEPETLKDARRTTGFKHYEDFTKRFDQPQTKTKLRAPYYK